MNNEEIKTKKKKEEEEGRKREMKKKEKVSNPKNLMNNHFHGDQLLPVTFRALSKLYSKVSGDKEPNGQSC